MHTLTIHIDDRQISLASDQTALEAIIEAGLGRFVEADCGGTGACGTCRLRVLENAPPPSLSDEEWLTSEELAAGMRLACRLDISQDMAVQLEAPAHLRHSKEELIDHLDFELEPAIRKRYLALPPPDLNDQRSDWQRVQSEAGADITPPPLAMLRQLPDILRTDNFRATVVLHRNRVIAVEPGDTGQQLLAAAVDIGTTTIALYLLDLTQGRRLAVAADANPQAVYGADVISRIAAIIEDSTALGEMQRLAAKTINELAAEAARRSDLSPADIYEMVVVGNTSMLQLFAGVDPHYLAGHPYVPAFNEPLTLSAAELGLTINPAARACILPGIGSYVGADITADILAARLHRLPGTRLLIDVGTNGEIVLAHNGQLTACATAAGPAFEGAHIEQGMRAADGAIEYISQDGRFELSVIGEAKPRGLCGSGLLDAVAALLRAEILEPKGRLRPAEAWPPELQDRFVRTGAGFRAFELAESVHISQKDVRQLQMAKGAIRAGIEILLKETGIEPEDIEETLLAGAFGSYIAPASALSIGLLPPMPVDRIRAIGNSAGTGATLAAFSLPTRDELIEISRRVEYIELSARSDFQEIFLKALNFPVRSDSL